MGKMKQRQDEDQVETNGHPAAKAARSVHAVDENAAKPASKEAGLRSQGDVGKEVSTPEAQTEPTAADAKSVVTRDGPGNLRSQGAVALASKTEAGKFSNAHMRAESAKKAAASTTDQAKIASAAPKGGQASKELHKDKSQSAPNASDLDATLPEAEVSTRPPTVADKKPHQSKTGVGTEQVASNEKRKMVKAPLAVAPKSDVEVVKAEPVVAPKPEATPEAVAPIISLKVAVKMDKATLVMNPKSEATLDDAEATVAPKSAVKPEKDAPSNPPNVEVKKDKATPAIDPKAAVDAAKPAPASAPKVEVKLDKRESVKASKKAATADEPTASEPVVEPPAEPETAPSEGEDELEGVDRSAEKGEDLQDTTQRAQKTGSVSERRRRRTRERRTHKDASKQTRV